MPYFKRLVLHAKVSKCSCPSVEIILRLGVTETLVGWGYGVQPGIHVIDFPQLSKVHGVLASAENVIQTEMSSREASACISRDTL